MLLQLILQFFIFIFSNTFVKLITLTYLNYLVFSATPMMFSSFHAKVRPGIGLSPFIEALMKVAIQYNFSRCHFIIYPVE